ATVGWGTTTCPGLHGRACDVAVTSCRDVAACLVCGAEAAADETTALLAVPPAPSVMATGETALARCRRTLAARPERLLSSEAATLQRCETRVMRGAATGPCPDAPASDRIARLRHHAAVGISRACGGPDGRCGGGDDLLPADIGFPDLCPDVTIPAGAACA